MIQANELRVGNFYHIKHGKGWTETKITESIMGSVFSESAEYALNNFEPIRLNREILERCGFVLIPGYVFVFYNAFVDLCFGRLYIEYYIGDFSCSIKEQQGDKAAAFGRFKNLHQLQNFYFIVTGQELPII